MQNGIENFKIKKQVNNRLVEKIDTIAIEEPLEIQIKREGKKPKAISVTMRTPGDDQELAFGFLFTEGVLKSYTDVNAVSYDGDNIIKIHVAADFDLPTNSLERNFYTTSSCGVCGKASIDAIYTKSVFNVIAGTKITKKVLFSLKDKLVREQSLFTKTGGIHAAALFSMDGNLESVFEDVGRHNALDKLVGNAFKTSKLPFCNKILLLSGRASFELIQKATMAGISNIVAVGAPSSLAVKLAKQNGQTLIGFLKESSFNIYAS